MARKFVVSPTKLRMYKQCPAQYRLEYIDKLGRFYHRARAGFAFGHSLHRALDAFHNAPPTEVVSPEAVAQSLETVWVAKGYQGVEQEAAFKTEATRILQTYHAVHAAAREEAEKTPTPRPPRTCCGRKKRCG